MTLEEEILLRRLFDPGVQRRFWNKVTVGAADVCWPWTAARDKDGYGLFKLDGRLRRAHRIAWMMAHAAAVTDLGGHHGGCICHQCDNPCCCNPDCLFLGSMADNVMDMYLKSRGPTGDRSGQRTCPEAFPRGDDHWTRLFPERVLRGDAHGLRKHPERAARGAANGVHKSPRRGTLNGRAKLTEDAVRQIRAALAEGMSKAALARRFAVSESTVRFISNGTTWRNMENK